MSATGPTTPGETCEVGGCELPSRGVAFTNAGDYFRSCGTPNHGRDFRPDAGGGGESGCPPECPNRLGPTCAHRRNYGITSAPALPVGGDAEGRLTLARAWHDYYCHQPDDEVHDLDQEDYDRADETLEALEGWLAAIAREAAERALVEAADEVHREARWQWEKKTRVATISTERAEMVHGYAAAVLAEVESIIRDRAASLGDGSGT